MKTTIYSLVEKGTFEVHSSGYQNLKDAQKALINANKNLFVRRTKYKDCKIISVTRYF